MPIPSLYAKILEMAKTNRNISRDFRLTKKDEKRVLTELEKMIGFKKINHSGRKKVC